MPGRRAVALVLSTLLVGAGSACSDRHDQAAPAATRLEVGIVPVIDARRLEVVPKPSQAGATIVATVLSGNQQIGFSNNTSLLIAASKGAPLRIVAAGNQASDGDYAVIFARSGGPIRAASDLAGKRIAVNNLNNVGPLSVNAALEASGVDISGVKFVEIPFPQMGAALTQGRVDAAWAVEPFVSAIKAAGGARTVLRTYPLIAPHFPVASYFTRRAYAASDADVVNRFREAMNESLAYAQAHPDEVRAILPTYIDLSPKVAAGVTLPEWNAGVDTQLLRRTADLALRYGYLSAVPDLSQLVGP